VSSTTHITSTTSTHTQHKMQAKKRHDNEETFANLLRVAVINLNNLTPVHCTRLFLRDMISKGRGAVLNVSSVAGHGPQPGNCIYGASKAFLRSFSMSLNYELQHTPVSVCCLSPGAFRSEFADTSVKNNSNKSILYTWPIPGMCTSSMYVAKKGLEGLWKGQAEVIPSLFYQKLAQLISLAPPNLTNWASVLLWSQPERREISKLASRKDSQREKREQV